jgi:hypothetical protein
VIQRGSTGTRFLLEGRFTLCLCPLIFPYFTYRTQSAGIAQRYSARLQPGRSGGSSPGRDWQFFSSPERLWEPTQPPIQ